MVPIDINLCVSPMASPWPSQSKLREYQEEILKDFSFLFNDPQNVELYAVRPVSIIFKGHRTDNLGNKINYFIKKSVGITFEDQKELDSKKSFWREVECNNILLINGIEWMPKLLFHNDRDTMIFEWIEDDGRLLDFLTNKRNKSIKNIMKDLKKLKIIHGDIHAGQFISSRGKLYLTDFGTGTPYIKKWNLKRIPKYEIVFDKNSDSDCLRFLYKKHKDKA